jgi:hypothetical protein
MLYTSLALLRKAHACSGGLSTLQASLPANQTDDKLISLSHILKSNGLDHAIWALRATTVDARKIAARMAIDFAYTSLPIFEKAYPEDKRPRKALEVASAFLDGKATLAEVNATAAAARTAASAAASATAWATPAAEAARTAAEAARTATEAARTEAARTAERAAAAATAWTSAATAAENERIFRKHLRTARPIGAINDK